MKEHWPEVRLVADACAEIARRPLEIEFQRLHGGTWWSLLVKGWAPPTVRQLRVVGVSEDAARSLGLRSEQAVGRLCRLALVIGFYQRLVADGHPLRAGLIEEARASIEALVRQREAA